jgi:hypothetical protein
MEVHRIESELIERVIPQVMKKHEELRATELKRDEAHEKTLNLLRINQRQGIPSPS